MVRRKGIAHTELNLFCRLIFHLFFCFPLHLLLLPSRLTSRRIRIRKDFYLFLPEVIETLGDLGNVSVFGRLAGPVPSFNTATLFFRRIRIGGVAVGAYTNAEARAAWEQVLKVLSRTGARPLVDSVFPFEELPKAFKRLAEGPMGKVLLQVAK